MFTMQYFISPPQAAEELFSPVAGYNNEGVMASFHNALAQTRKHLMAALDDAQGSHESLCYNFHVATCLLSSILDGIAVYVEKKVSVSPRSGDIYWHGHTTFLDPLFAELRAVRQTTSERIIKGGISLKTLHNFSKHYLPWMGLAACGNNDTWDIRFPIDSETKSGPVIRGLMVPLYNDACDAYQALGKLLDVDPKPLTRC